MSEAGWTRRGLLAGTALALLAVSLGCANRRVHLSAAKRAGLTGKEYQIVVHRRHGAIVTGWIDDYRRGQLVVRLRSGELEFVAMNNISKIYYQQGEIRGDQVQMARNIAIGLAVVLGLPAILVLTFLVLVLATSCPFVYVIDPKTGERRRVGEAYAGAVVASLARDDVMALPGVSAGEVQLALTNEAPEIQYTDAAELWFVDHDPVSRVLPTHDARLVELGPAVAPVQLEDLEGVDQAHKLGADDPEVGWATQLFDAVERRPRPTQEGLTALFGPAPQDAAIEVVLRTSPWLDRLSLLGWAALGTTRRAKVHEAGRDPNRADRARELMEQGGIYALIEVREGGVWREVARIPPVGWVAPRTVVVPLGIPAGEAVEVRITGGVGFLVVYDMRLAQVIGEVEPIRVAPATAVQSTGEDELERLAAVDDDSNVLAEMNEEVLLTFDLPDLPAESARSCFLRTHGYYEVHPPDDFGAPSAALKGMRDPEQFSAVGLEIFEELYGGLAEAEAP